MSENAASGRVALVTGASRGIGAATAERLRGDGYQVYGVARGQPEIDGAWTGSPEMHFTSLDVADREAVNGLAGAMAVAHDGIDILVCAAGTNIPRRRFDELSLDDWRRIVDVNVTGIFNVAQACLPLLRRRSGLIVVVASVSARWADASGPAYQASKHAALGLAHAISLEEQAAGIRVSVILPGLVDTSLLDARPEPPPAEVRMQALRPTDVAEVCAFLASLPPRVIIPEIVMMPSALQRIGRTW